ncbi:hypothetical protein H0H92_014277, partial [Tricholoma furcatifolium]
MVNNSTGNIPQVTYALAVLTDVIENNAVTTYTIYAATIIPTFADSDVTDNCFFDCGVFSKYTVFNAPHKGKAATEAKAFKILGSGTSTPLDPQTD